MAQTILETDPANLYAILLTLTWGDSSVARFCRYDDDLIMNGDLFTSLPSIEIETNEQHGGTDDSPMSVTVRHEVEPFLSLSRPEAFTKVKVLIEGVAVDDETSRHELFYGTVGKCVVNPNGAAGLIRCPVVGIKSRLKVIAGMSATPDCPWQFGEPRTCKKDIEPHKRTQTIAAVNVGGVPNAIQAVLTGDMSNLRWAAGYIEIDKLRIVIRASNGSGIFQLRQIPPSGWLGQSALFVPGCRKGIANCRYWENEANFCGFGFAMPGYNPLVETA